VRNSRRLRVVAAAAVLLALAVTVIVVLAPGHRGGHPAGTAGTANWPDHPPAAALAVGSKTATWLSLRPLQYAWFVPARDGSPIVGPMWRNWLRLPDSPSAGKAVLYLQASRAPMLIELLRYRALTAAGVPDGQPDPVTCTASVGCAVRGCHRGTVAGQCIAIDDSSYQADRVVVLYALWAVPGVPLSEIEKNGPPTDAASWGFESDPAGKDRS
jgi:hypothetical protein